MGTRGFIRLFCLLRYMFEIFHEKMKKNVALLKK